VDFIETTDRGIELLTVIRKSTEKGVTVHNG